MKRTLSRRDFMGNGTIALGAVLALDLCGVMGAAQAQAANDLAATGSQESIMPHVSVRLWPGRSEGDKLRLAEAITEALVRTVGCSESSVSVSIEEVPSAEWKENVYEPEIRRKSDTLYKKPGYTM